MKKAELFIPIVPVPKGRPRFTRSGHSYTPERTETYERAVCEYYKNNCGEFFDGAIKLFLTFYMPIPKSTSKKRQEQMLANVIKHTVHNGDLDNLCKSVMDALNTIAYKDDSQITIIHAYKRYGATAGIELKIEEDVS
jgi:Holliday junction resolvase RusA-like endonuclease